MADVRPFCALRYRPDVAGDLGSLLSPPFDVIDAEHQAELHRLSPHNIVRVELGEQRPDDGPEDNRYTRAEATLAGWRESGAIAQDERPAFYVDVQEFDHDGERRRRTALFARVRLEPWEAGVVLPHEETMAAPKKDRLELLRHLRTNISPVFVLYRDPERRLAPVLSESGKPLAAAETPDGQRHTLSAVNDDSAIESIAAALRDAPLYIADGHHRYETALAYRDERRKQATEWTGEEPENFVMLALTAIEDPGLTLLPIHRLVRPRSVPDGLPSRLERYFRVEVIEAGEADGSNESDATSLLARLASAGASGTAIVAMGLERNRRHLLTLKDAPAAQELMPRSSKALRELDMNVLEYAVLREALGLRGEADAEFDYAHDAARVVREVDAGRWPLGFLLNGPDIGQILSIADASERMPRKTTFFDPKLATGLVLNPFD